MKTTFLIILILLISKQTIAQDNTPKLLSIVMIGKTSKPILDFCIVDSTKKGDFKFDEHIIVLYADRRSLSNIYSSIQSEEKYDSLTKYDYSFGTFLFTFRFESNEKFKIVATRIQSIALFKRIIGTLSPNNQNEVTIIKEIEGNLLQRINY
jgi:hypothetical protein